MPVKVFISHSVAPRELALVNSVADVAAQRGAIPTIPDRAWSPPEPLPHRVEAQIKASDYVIAIGTRGGQHWDWLKQEIGYSRQLSPSRPTLLVADHEILGLPSEAQGRQGTVGLITGEIQFIPDNQNLQRKDTLPRSHTSVVVMNRQDPLSTLSQVRTQIDHLVQDANTQQILGGLVVGGLALLFLSLLKKD